MFLFLLLQLCDCVIWLIPKITQSLFICNFILFFIMSPYDLAVEQLKTSNFDFASLITAYIESSGYCSKKFVTPTKVKLSKRLRRSLTRCVTKRRSNGIFHYVSYNPEGFIWWAENNGMTAQELVELARTCGQFLVLNPDMDLSSINSEALTSYLLPA